MTRMTVPDASPTPLPRTPATRTRELARAEERAAAEQL
jgi:hypothetical protein